MKDKSFIDSKILIYAHTMQDERKKVIAQRLLSLNDIFLINTQVVNELINVLIKRFKIDFNELQKIVDEILYYLPVMKVDIKTIKSGLAIHHNYKFSYYDSLIITSALENGCTILYSEDLHNKQKIENTLTIINPFK